MAASVVDVAASLGVPDAVLAQVEAIADYQIPLVAVVFGGLAVLLAVRHWWQRRQAVYLLDLACFKPPDRLKVSVERFLTGSRASGMFSEESLDFQRRISNSNGLSEETYLAPSLEAFEQAYQLREQRAAAGLPTSTPAEDTLKIMTMVAAREESSMVMFGSVQDVLDRCGLRPTDIDILVVNCSLFNPTPSLASMIINHFGMRTDILSFNLGGMGCSAGVIAIGLAQKVLQTEPNKVALVVSTENVTFNWYLGNDRSMLIPNTLFRIGGAAVVLTNKPSWKSRCKYELEHVVRVHMGKDDKAYHCVFQREDDDGRVGVELNRDLVKVAGKALETNLTRLGPLVLPLSEKVKFGWNMVQRKIIGLKVSPYVPDFKKAFKHFCLHAGGRAVIEGLGGKLGLTQDQTAASFNALYWYGNTSSGSLWYELSFIEACQKIRKGDTVWMVGFGSGFKCNSMVWRALRNVKDDKHIAWEHMKQPGMLNKVWEYLEANKLQRSASKSDLNASASTNSLKEE